ncbi:sigma-70 family RNA polymerase sigma factor [Eubacteriales bacterium OttesenSCG-928-K08]|nr:sigma-70 family RNA polymerase sigma factor [Eubacteriales bacterium OttesenSCG-928-K08]
METPARKWLSLATEREALARMEDAARTVEQFEQVIEQWNHLDENRERKERYHETPHSQPLLEWGTTLGNAIIPQPFSHVFWRQLLNGSFLDVLFDCPYELHEQVASRAVSRLLFELNENQKEVLYYWAIRQYSPQRIAKLRGQSDRNILKVQATLIMGIREKLYKRLAPRYDAKLPLTFAQQQFVEDYRAGRLKAKQPNKSAKKTTLDEKNGD